MAAPVPQYGILRGFDLNALISGGGKQTMVTLKLAALLSIASIIMALPLLSYNQPVERGMEYT
ncbi:hypothetical protein P691DRAFT_760237 [Macrolepiota fuliginosa MF-IS2]|uniref:Uncharacterized protein n=1 Tax=Macrolepiota fuliginosa MF-IS2 TaxID=1400762 RepID=A0A9P5XAX1_9AGAR|nr:hypothetical protein P691DRAFT_760237 [Macrolepiota fuliginosa MF-IS2]